MNTKKIKEKCKNIISIIEDYESTYQKAKINDILISLDLEINDLIELTKEVS